METPIFPNEIVQSKYTTWALARRGTSNPQNMTNPVWTWMMKDKFGPYKANQLLDKTHEHQPGWSYYRMGQTETLLPDGTKILIAGEHEDSYDPDFFIYNDVTVLHPDGEITFYGYPEYLFPPTDNHSATLVEDKIYIIGCLGYPHQRHKDKTPVYCLDISDYSVRKVWTSGSPPNWLHRHNARLSDDAKFIICDGGETIHPSGNYLENLAEWQLEISTGEWTKLSEKKWVRWTLCREDGSRNDLWNMRQLEWAQSSGRKNKDVKKFLDEVRNRRHEIDLEFYKARHQPPIPHSIMDEDDNDFRTTRVLIEGVVLRIVEESYEIAFNLEGELPEHTVELLQSHYLNIYSRLEGMSYAIEIID